MEALDQTASLLKKNQVLLKSLYDYSDDNNPFGDPNLSKPFFWLKKNQKFLSLGMDPTYFNEEKTILSKIKNAKQEIDYLKKLRNERENNKALSKFQPLESDLEFKEKDENFLLDQEQLRTEIRLKQGREKPIDFLLNLLNIYKGKTKIPKNFYKISTYQKPYEIFDLLSLNETKEIFKDIQFYVNISKDDKNYWNSLFNICGSKIFKEKKDLYSNKEIVEVINGCKNLKDLEILETELKNNLSKEIKLNEIEFWKNALEILNIEKSKFTLDDIYNTFFNKNKEELRKIKENETDNDNFIEDDNDLGKLSPILYESDEELRKNSISEHDYLFKMSENRKKILSYKLNLWKKKYIEEINAKGKNEDNMKEMDSDEEVQNFLSKISKKPFAEDSKDYLGKKRKEETLREQQNFEAKFEMANDISTVKESRFCLQEDNDINNKDIIEEIHQVEDEVIADDENLFNESVPVNSNYDWSNKYKPIKPRYSNRVTVGYEWNKYNQVHYTFENPPPKIIQGYKFNIFYPYLIDKTKTPSYTLERSDTEDMCVIRFHAGPPYEDIAFKIANREWDMTERAGFKNLFDRGILRLYFRFKRYRYRR